MNLKRLLRVVEAAEANQRDGDGWSTVEDLRRIYRKWEARESEDVRQLNQRLKDESHLAELHRWMQVLRKRNGAAS
jgi:hypothetical protein